MLFSFFIACFFENNVETLKKIVEIYKINVNEKDENDFIFTLIRYGDNTEFNQLKNFLNIFHIFNYCRNIFI